MIEKRTPYTHELPQWAVERAEALWGASTLEIARALAEAAKPKWGEPDKTASDVAPTSMKGSTMTKTGQGQTTAVETQEPILQFFAFEHLPEHLRAVSQPFGALARHIVETLPRNPERTVALRKLLEAKDAAVRARLYEDTFALQHVPTHWMPLPAAPEVG